MSNMKPRDQALFNLEAKISRFGWTAYYISGGPGPDWHYTIGLVDRFDHPELITLGLDHRSAHAAAHEVVHRLETGVSLTPGRKAKHSLLEIPMALVPVDDAYWMAVRLLPGMVGLLPRHGQAAREAGSSDCVVR